MKLCESGGAPCRGYGSACLEDGRINRSLYSSFFENCPGSGWSGSQRILAATLGMKILARWVQDRSFTTASLREPISQLVDSDTVDPGWDGEFMDNAFVFARHVHGGQLQLHRNKGDLHGFESQHQLAQESITDTRTCPKLTGELRCRQWRGNTCLPPLRQTNPHFNRREMIVSSNEGWIRGGV